MRREPPSRQQRVALTCSRERFPQHTHLTVDDAFTREYVILLKRFVRRKSASIDGHQLLLGDRQQESNCRFVFGFRWNHILVTAPTICENEHGEFVLSMRSTSTCGQATRARRLVALAALELRFYIEFVDLSRAFELDSKCVRRSQKALDVPVDVLYETSISTSNCL